MNTPLTHPLDLAGATGDREAACTPWAERPARHLDADDGGPATEPAAWRRLPSWIDIPLRPLVSEHPAASIVAVASLFTVIVAMVML